MDELTKDFIAESQEGLDRMERCLTDLEVRPGDAGLVDEIFRAVHTIKGTTGFLGFTRLEALAHAGEHLLGMLRDGKLEATAELITGLLALMDGLRGILVLIDRTGGEGSRAADEDSGLILMLEGLRGETGSKIRWAGEAQVRVDGVLAEMPAAEGLAADLKGEVAGEGPPSGVKADLSKEEGRGEAAAGPGSGGSQEKTLRIDVEVLNRMMNLVGELVLTRNQILQSGLEAANFAQLTRRLDSVTAELRETVMQARMQPVGHLFGKFPRMVRDVARTCGKSVRVEFSGQDTGLDKSLLEAIKDPLAHAVRNAIDHGIEGPAERMLAGKGVEGVLRLKAFHESGWVVIEVADDGAGIPLERVRAKAVERGLVTAEKAAGMTEREVLQMIFLPGFSTAATVTHVSGRGVGMDVVRANVEKVRGSVEVESRVGVGTTLRLRIPLTLAIVPALVVRSGGQSFALPQSALVELMLVPKREVSTTVEKMGGAEVCRLRDRLLPLVWLDRLLGLVGAQGNGCEAQGFYIAVLEAGGNRFGLVVDDLLDPEEIVVKPLTQVLREIGLFSGATVLGNGTLALILDVAALAARAGVKALAEGVSLNPVVAGGLEKDGAKSFLVFETQRRERTAIPLDAVERIESVARGAIEYAGHRAVLQYRGELLELEDEGGVLGAIDEEGETVTVLICSRPGARGPRRVGVVVRQVLDVSTGMMLTEEGESDGEPLALVEDKVTMVRREFAGVKDAGRTAASWTDLDWKAVA